MASISKKLLKKIDKHVKTKRHEACVKNAKVAASELTEQAFSVQNRRFEELHANQIAATEKVFRVAYLCAKENLSFAKHAEIISCHQLNGTDMGSLLYSPVTWLSEHRLPQFGIKVFLLLRYAVGPRCPIP